MAATQATATKKQELIGLEKQRTNAMVTGNIAALDAILAEDLTYVHTGARLDTKASFLESIRSGRTKYQAMDMEDVAVRLCGDGVGSSPAERRLESPRAVKPCGLQSGLRTCTSDGTDDGKWWPGSPPACRNSSSS